MKLHDPASASVLYVSLAFRNAIWPGPLLGILLVLFLAPAHSPAATGTPFRDKVTNNLVSLIVATADCSYYAQKSRSSPPTKVDASQFGKYYLVGTGGFTGNEKDSDDELIEALDPDNSAIVGYFRGGDVIYGRSHAVNAPKLEDPTRLSNIFRKALVVNYYNRLDEATLQRELQSGNAIPTKNGGYITIVPAVNAPGASSKNEQNILAQLELWEHRFVWKEVTRNGGVWYLLGDKGEISDPSEPSGLIGWVPGDKVQLWDTSQAVEPNWLTRDIRFHELGDRGAGARVFTEKPVAIQALALSDPSSLEKDTMISEDLRQPAGQWPASRARYPLIRTDTQGRTNQIYQLAWIGGLFDLASGEEVASAESVDTGTEKVRNMIRGLFTLDIVIVLDGTRSMQHLRQPAMDAIKQIVEHVRSQVPEGVIVRPEDVVTRCAVAVYRNRNDAGGPFPKFQFLTFQRLDGSDHSGIARVNDFLKRIVFDSRGGELRYEGVLDGIYSAAEQAALGQKGNPDSYRLMILVGDSGDQGGGKTIQETAKLLNDNHYDFYAISLPREDEISKYPDYKDFRLQLADLSDNLELPKGMAGKDGFDKDSHVLKLNNDFDKLSTTILQACAKGVEVRNTVQRVLANPKEYPMQLQGYVQNILTQRGVNMELFKKNRQQVLGVGWTAMRNGKGTQQWTVMEYVERKQLDAYRQFVVPFETLNTSADSLDPTDVENINRSLKRSFQIAAGQYDEKRQIKDVMGDAARDLPVHSKLLSMTVPDLLSYLQRPDPATKAERKLELERLKLCSKILQAYIIDYQFSYKTDENGRIIDIETDERRTASYWSARGKFDYGWVPEEVFP
jgi:hypothetical protein